MSGTDASKMKAAEILFLTPRLSDGHKTARPLGGRTITNDFPSSRCLESRASGSGVFLARPLVDEKIEPISPTIYAAADPARRPAERERAIDARGASEQRAPRADHQL